MKHLVYLGLAFIANANALGTRIEDSQNDVDQILDLHNTFRAQHGSQPLVWHQELVDSAAAWAKECKWEHSTSAFRSGAGENLYAGTGSPVEDSYNAAALGWYKEIDMYNFDDPGDLSKTTRGFVDIGHFTAMVWSDTEALGCARQICPPNEFSPFKEGDAADVEWAYVVCHYAEAGNRLSAGKDEYKLFRQNVVPVLEDVPPLPPIRSCSSDTVALDIEVTAVGSTCDAASTLVDAIEEVSKTLKCRHGWNCSGYTSSSMPFTTFLTLEIPQTDAKRVTDTLVDDRSLLEIVWTSAQVNATSIKIQDMNIKQV